MKPRLHYLALVLVAPLIMGNESCEQQPDASSGRRLRRQIELEKIQAQKISFPGAENFDFEYVVNAQIFDAISETDKFVVAYAAADPAAPSTLTQRDLMALAEPGSIRPFDAGVDPFGDPNDPNLCVARAPLLMITGEVRSFEVVAGGGLWFGFTSAGKGNGPTGGTTSIDVQHAKMEVGMKAYNPLTRTVYGTGMALPGHTKVDINASIDFGTFSLGPKFYFQSRLAGVTMKGLKAALAALAADLDGKASKDQRPLWETRLIKDYDTHVTIRAGRRHGLQVGDEFVVYNLDHYWEDDTQPCRSRYLGSVRNTDQPIALLRVSGDRDLGDEFTRLEVVMQDDNGTRRLPGAQVVIHKLVEAKKDKTQDTSTASLR
jgi:hypothetical protein